jgi:predicted aspartyl protease
VAERQAHRAFTIAYNGIARELVTHGSVIAPDGTSFDVKCMVWDTGATGSAIHPDVIRELGLVPVGMADVQGDGGIREASVYIVKLGLPNNVHVNVQATDGDYGDGTEVLVGMDVIAHGDFVVQNCDGKTHFSFCVPPFKNKLNVVEKATTINNRLERQNRRG